MNSIESAKKKELVSKKSKQTGRTTYQKELQQIRDTCSLLKHLSTAIQSEAKFRQSQDLADLNVSNNQNLLIVLGYDRKVKKRR